MTTIQATDWPELNYPLGPKPWRIDLEGSDRPVSIRIVAADGNVAFDLTLPFKAAQLEDDLPGSAGNRMDLMWEIGLRLAEDLTGASRYADAPRMARPGFPHTVRYWATVQAGHPYVSDVACPVCGEEAGNPCS